MYVPRWAEPLLPPDGPVCQADVEQLIVRRRTCGRLALTCFQRALAAEGPFYERLECALPDLAAWDCGETPYAPILGICDCFPYEDLAVEDSDGDGSPS